MAAERRSFEAEIEAARGGGALVAIPFDVREIYGTGGRVSIRATFDGAPYRGSLAPMGGGRHVLGIPKAIRAAVGKDVGDRVKVVVERDTEPRTVDLPADLARALSRAPAAGQVFEKLSYSHRKEYVRWVEEAKKEETRARRIEKTIAMLTQSKTR